MGVVILCITIGMLVAVCLVGAGIVIGREVGRHESEVRNDRE